MRWIVLILASALAAILVIVGLYAILYSGSGTRRYVPMGTQIRQDDFTYTITGAHKLPSLGGRRANGVYYVVRVKLDNHALRVPFRWQTNIVQIIDAQGARYESVPASPSIAKKDGLVGPGSSATFSVVFDVPADIHRPAVTFNNGILMGDALDFVAYRRVAVSLQ